MSKWAQNKDIASSSTLKYTTLNKNYSNLKKSPRLRARLQQTKQNKNDYIDLSEIDIYPYRCLIWFCYCRRCFSLI